MSQRHRVGYILFALSGLMFIVIGIRDRDLPTLVAAMLWMAGCTAFLTEGSDDG